ncbi:hypothetical protein K1T71_014367 [Dendrolimus kikuchii]|uniref:Uncharacterized protein n=1 Tax=Dendrolimus kikuchii TaxID=765133 RepID=A0ACC1CE36_9NEOP|nr:hypothetical protein K1T71_014367 [Dendrolimus kikuchii]
MHAISNTVFQEIWERLTKAQFNINDGKPLFVCYICYAQLRNAHQLMQRASKAEELLTTVMNNDSEEIRQTTLCTASLTHHFRYKYAIKEAYQLECKQFERNSVDEIKKEKEEGSEENNEEGSEENNGERSEENNEEEIDIKIKEEEEDICQEENLDSADDESGIPLDDTLLKNKLEKEVQINLEKTDISASNRKGTINEMALDVPNVVCNNSCMVLRVTSHLPGDALIAEKEI